MALSPLSLAVAVQALDAGALQFRLKDGWFPVRRAEVQFSYPRNPQRISVLVGRGRDGLDQGELNRHPGKYRVA